MSTVRDVYNYIDEIAPFDTAMDFDNCGMLVGNYSEVINKVLLSLDITPDVVKEAKKLGANLIISHHPVIFNPIKRLDSNSVPYLLAKNGISAICAHTNLDMADCGVNTALADLLGIKDREGLSVYKSKNYNKVVVFTPTDYTDSIKCAMTLSGAGTLGDYCGCSFQTEGQGSFLPMEGAKPFLGKVGEYENVIEDRLEMVCPKGKTDSVTEAMLKAHPYEVPAYDIFETSAIKEDVCCGIIGNIESEMLPKDFAQHVKVSLNCNGVRYIPGKRKINKVAFCSGAGGDLIYKAVKKGADAFVTGEIKHHEILSAMAAGVTVVDAGHFCTEDVVIDPLLKMLSSKFENIEFVKSNTYSNMLEYV